MSTKDNQSKRKVNALQLKSSDMTGITQKKLADILPHGSMRQIADELSISKQAVSAAIKAEKPSHPAVVIALRICREAGTLAAAQDLSMLAHSTSHD